MRVRGGESLRIIEIILTIVQTDVGSPSSKSLFSGKPTESVHAVVEVYVDNRFTELDRTLNDSATIVRGCVTDCERSTIEPL